MNELEIFEHPKFGQIRTITENGVTLFCGKDVAEALGYAKPQNAIAAHCKGALKRGIGVQTGTKADGSPAMQQVGMLFIPEGDIYRLAAKSELPGAGEFESWIFDEVLPSIRKHGGYLTPDAVEAALLNPDVLIRLATELKTERDRRKDLENQIAEDRPRVLFADAVTVSPTSILVRELAKLLRQREIPMGQNRLFTWLRENGWLIRQKGEDYNLPTQKAMELGLFEIKESVHACANGQTRVTRTPKVTGKGQVYFMNLFLDKEALK